MDEIDELRELRRKLLKRHLIIFCIIAYFVLLIVMLEKNDKVFKFESITIIVLIYIFAFFIIIYPVLIEYFKLKNRCRNKKTIDITSMKNIAREVSDEYSPAICSFLYNKKIESYSDYTATILYLESKNYIKIIKENDDYSIKILNDNIEDLSEHEKYAFECITKKYKFSTYMLEHYIIKDAINLGLTEQKIFTSKHLFLSDILGLILFIIALALIPLLKEGTTLIMFLALIISARAKDNKKEILTDKGKEVRDQVMGLKSFIREYTLLKERSIEYKELFGNYIAYALSLGEAGVVNEFVKENEQYRDLIYNRIK